MAIVISASLALCLLKEIDKEIEIAEDKAFTPDERDEFRTLCKLSRDLETATKAEPVFGIVGYKKASQ